MNLRLFILVVGEDLLIAWRSKHDGMKMSSGPSHQADGRQSSFGIIARMNITSSYNTVPELYPAANFIVRQINCLIHINSRRDDGIRVSLLKPPDMAPWPRNPSVLARKSWMLIAGFGQLWLGVLRPLASLAIEMWLALIKLFLKVVRK